MSTGFRYAAFISYSRKDADFARRLHRRLERYVIHASLGSFDIVTGGKRNRIYPVFRDQEELAAGNLPELLKANLKNSAALIVVCSPNSATSWWVQEEIEGFIRTRGYDRIFAIVASDAPYADPDNAVREAYWLPKALAGATGRGHEAKAVADAREGKDGFRFASLKIIAGIIGANAGALEDRDSVRRRRTASIAILSTLIFSVCLATTLTIASNNETIDLLNVETDRLLHQHRYMEALTTFVAASNLGSLEHASEFPMPVLLDFGYLGDEGGVDFHEDGWSAIVSEGGGEIRRISLQPPFGQLPLLNDPPGKHVFPLSDHGTFMTVSEDGAVSVAVRREPPDEQAFDSRELGVRIVEKGKITVSKRGDIAVLVARADSVSLADAELYRWSNRSVISLGEIRRSGGLQFSPTGKHLLLSSPKDGARLLSPDGNYDPVSLGQMSIGSRYDVISWAGDIQFSTDDAIAVARAPAGRLNRIALSRSESEISVGRISSEARWLLSPDGKWTAAWTQPDKTQDDGELVLMDTSEAAETRVLGPADQYDEPTFTKDSRFVIYETNEQIKSLHLEKGEAPVTVQNLAAGNLDITPMVRLISSKPEIVTVAKDGVLRHHVVDRASVVTRPIARVGDPNILRASEGGRFLLVGSEATNDLWAYDLASSYTAQNTGKALCFASQNAIRPVSEPLRSSNGGASARNPLHRKLRGRPWHPCDWRGLDEFEGWRQFGRRIAVIYFGSTDYTCEERNAAGYADGVSKARCERMRTLHGPGGNLAK